MTWTDEEVHTGVTLASIAPRLARARDDYLAEQATRAIQAQVNG